MSEEHKQVIQRADTQIEKMSESPHIWTNTDYANLDDSDFDESKIFWMGTNANLVDTPQEQLENRLAIQHQMKVGILDESGIPVGFTYDELGIPKEMQEQLKAAKLQKQQQAITRTQQSPIPTQVPIERKIYSNKWERKLDREKTRQEEKLARANNLIARHQKELAKRK